MKLALGSVQFGLDYGISNVLGRPDEAEVHRILADAKGFGIEMIDTAALYGEAEAVLGRCWPTGSPFHIVTKTPSFRGRPHSAAEVADIFQRSLDRLGVESLHGLLAHRADDLLESGGDTLWAAMERLRAAGRVARIGASLYSAAQVGAMLDRYDLNLVQLPLNVLDQRLALGGDLARLKARSVEIHARSALLQGLLLMNPDLLPAHFVKVRPVLHRFRGWCAERRRSPLAGALDYVLSQPQVDHVVCGVVSAAQLADLVAAVRSFVPALGHEGLALDDDSVLNPNLWPR